MSYAAHVDDDRSRGGPWCARGHHRHGPWHPALIILLILSFIFWWPLGLAVLAYILWSKGMGCWGRNAHWQDKMDQMRNKVERAWGGRPSSGNHAFDEYRTETLRRLEEEEKEFRDFLERLRAAKDKAEFDQFMAERRNRSGGATPAPQN